MKFTSYAECFIGHDHPDISDIAKRSHDIVPSIIRISIYPCLPRDQCISKIPKVLLILEKENASQILIFLLSKDDRRQFQMLIEPFDLDEIRLE